MQLCGAIEMGESMCRPRIELLWWHIDWRHRATTRWKPSCRGNYNFRPRNPRLFCRTFDVWSSLIVWNYLMSSSNKQCCQQNLIPCNGHRNGTHLATSVDSQSGANTMRTIIKYLISNQRTVWSDAFLFCPDKKDNFNFEGGAKFCPHPTTPPPMGNIGFPKLL